MDKKKIVIEVDPVEAVVAIGLIRSILPSIIEQLNRQVESKGVAFKFTNTEQMLEVYNEIYEKCIAETNIREFAQAHINGGGLEN